MQVTFADLLSGIGGCRLAFEAAGCRCVIYAFVDQHRDCWPVTVMADALGVSASGYHAWRGRPKSQRQQRRDRLLVETSAIHEQVKGRYGSPRIHAELEAAGHGCRVNTVAEVMRQAGIRAKSARKFKHTTDSNHSRPVAENVLSRQFRPSGPNEAWVADITYIPTREGWLYLAAVEDLYSRKEVGWSMDQTMTSRLVVDALEMAVQRRLPGEELVAHSDRGSQYASEHYQRLLSKHGIECGMSEVGQCWDNAPMESFFATLRKELVHQEDYATREEAKASIFEYIEVFYNRKRRHSTLGYESPEHYERRREGRLAMPEEEARSIPPAFFGPEPHSQGKGVQGQRMPRRTPIGKQHDCCGCELSE